MGRVAERVAERAVGQTNFTYFTFLSRAMV